MSVTCNAVDGVSRFSAHVPSFLMDFHVASQHASVVSELVTCLPGAVFGGQEHGKKTVVARLPSGQELFGTKKRVSVPSRFWKPQLSH